MKEYQLIPMLKDGYTEKYAKHFLEKMQFEYNSGLYSEEMLKDAYDRGFWAENYTQYLCGSHYEKYPDAYLTDYDYERLWPLNDWMRIWINDKLTLKYMLSGTQFEHVMPEYHYYMSQNGLRVLADNYSNNQTIKGFLELLKEKKEFACKPCNGTLAAGFHKLCYDGEYLLDGAVVSEKEVETFVQTHPNYLYTEFLYPERSLAEISDKVPTIRIVVLNRNGNDPYIVPSAYIRFGTESSGVSNFVDGKREGEFTVNAGVNIESGTYGNARAFYINKGIPLHEHPDSHVKIEGTIPNWLLMKETILGISKFFFGVEWMGFDLCVDRSGKVRIMEINSHPGIGYIQAFYPLLLDNNVRDYMDYKTDKLNRQTADYREKRNAIER